MIQTVLPPPLTAEVCARALNSRDARFDGLFYVGITSTNIYCRPICPARVSYPDRRRFFATAASAEGAGFRPCLRCRPELAPGRAPVDAVSQLARGAAERIGAGALNGRSVRALAGEFGVSERHLRRALEREVGVSPLELAQTHRLLLAKRLLADTELPVTRIAYASGFQSLRRFNALFRERYRMSPSAVRKGRAGGRESGVVRLTLTYRKPFAWDALLADLGDSAIPGVERVTSESYARTVQLEKKRGTVAVTNGDGHLNADISPSLLPVLMPLLARLRQLFDLDAEPVVIDQHLAQGGLKGKGGLRVAGAMDGFEVVLRTLVRGPALKKVIETYGEPFDGDIDGLSAFAPTAQKLIAAGEPRLRALGIPERNAATLIAVAREVASGRLRLEPSSDVTSTLAALRKIEGVSEKLVLAVATHALHWPDAFPEGDAETTARAEAWRPWRAYARRLGGEASGAIYRRITTSGTGSFRHP